jgi:hypothetical protein
MAQSAQFDTEQICYEINNNQKRFNKVSGANPSHNLVCTTDQSNFDILIGPQGQHQKQTRFNLSNLPHNEHLRILLLEYLMVPVRRKHDKGWWRGRGVKVHPSVALSLEHVVLYFHSLRK